MRDKPVPISQAPAVQYLRPLHYTLSGWSYALALGFCSKTPDPPQRPIPTTQVQGNPQTNSSEVSEQSNVGTLAYNPQIVAFK